MKKERIIELKDKAIATWKEEGTKALIERGKLYLKERKIRKQKRKQDELGFHEAKDILFINGCNLPHPQRYRVDHQIEQLESYGISCAKIDYDKVNLDLIKYFRAFVIYRCPITPDIEKLMKKAKENNKVLFYDIDDLVFDLEHTKMIKFLDTMDEKERDLYNDGVIRMGKTLKLCDYGIASTERLQIEMQKHLKEVFVNRNVASDIMLYYSELALKKEKKEDGKIILGYLSGSITHNDDFKLIMPSIINLMKKHENVYLQIVGLLDLPEEMEEFKERILTAPFMDFKKLPELIRSIDINLAPLENTIFNEAKSENKWTEASLVKIPTVASNLGAFKSQIEDNKTGLLANDEEWEEKLEKLIKSKELREELGENAYREVRKNHMTLKTGKNLAEFILSKLNKNIGFVVPSTNISGGILVTLKHAELLKKNGYDVTIINAENDDTNVFSNNTELNVIEANKTNMTMHMDRMVATMWLTLEYVKKYDNCNDKRYLVQNYETDFYEKARKERIKCESTYNEKYPIKYLTISKWCQNWLTKDYQKEVKYAPNGIDLDLFKYKKRDFKGKIKILIEGNCEDYYKNVDESFKITNQLDKEKFEINYLSYQKEPKSWYQVDNFYQKVPHNEVAKIYEENDILIKTSILESFSYPPLEMMATGGVCLVLPNDGNIEYLKDEENCLFYEQGNIEDAIKQIMRMKNDKKLRDKLIENGLKTAEKRSWEKIEEEVLKLYED